jgi:hypothetical protein
MQVGDRQQSICGKYRGDNFERRHATADAIELMGQYLDVAIERWQAFLR